MDVGLQAQNKIEMMIHNLLVLHGSSDIAADHLLKQFENENTSFEELKTISKFLLNCGFYATLVAFLIKKLKFDNRIPWGHLAEALVKANMSVSIEIRKALFEGAKSQKIIGELSLCQRLDLIDDRILQSRESRKKSFLKKQLRFKEDLLAQYEMFKSQGLVVEEEKLIERFIHFFPNDPTMRKAKETLHERQAMDLLVKKTQQKSFGKKTFFYDFADPKTDEIIKTIELTMIEELKSDSTLGVDFMVAMMMWERPQSALRISEYVIRTNEFVAKVVDWLMADAYLQSRHFVELLNFVAFLESKYVSDPEVTFAAIYLRAQALWGMEQKYSAMEMLESLLTIRPKYRSAHALLDEWKESFL